MRLGSNPNKVAQAPMSFRPIVLAVITHLTDNPYHNRHLEVIQTCLHTMRAGAHMDATMLVWDNGSTGSMGEGLRAWLYYDFKPDMLIQSGNVGKTSARTAICRMFHPGTVIAYADDDFFFYDNWLKPQIELLEHFPGVACVSGYPVRTAFRWGTENTKKWAKENAKLEAGRFLPRDWEDDFALSIGRDPAFHVEYTDEDYDYRVTYKGKTAYCTAHHAQFVGYAGVVGSIMQYDHLAMSEERTFDVALDKIGLRLSTTQRLARHIGNVMDDRIRRELDQLQSIAV